MHETFKLKIAIARDYIKWENSLEIYSVLKSHSSWESEGKYVETFCYFGTRCYQLQCGKKEQRNFKGKSFFENLFSQYPQVIRQNEGNVELEAVGNFELAESVYVAYFADPHENKGGRKDDKKKDSGEKKGKTDEKPEITIEEQN